MKVVQQPQKPPDGSNQIWATTSGKKERPPRSLYKPLLRYVATAAAGSNIKGCYVHWFKLWPQVRKIHPSDLRGH